MKEYVAAAKLALEAGFDGIEVHGANGYLIEQFLNPLVNLRGDGYGGNIEGRNRLALAKALSAMGLLYIHLVDHSSMGAPPLPADFKLQLRAAFDGLFILSGGFDSASAEQALLDKRGDLIAFGRTFLANPDLVARMQDDAPLNEPDPATFYVPGAKGYTDYPALSAATVDSK